MTIGLLGLKMLPTSIQQSNAGSFVCFFVCLLRQTFLHLPYFTFFTRIISLHPHKTLESSCMFPPYKRGKWDQSG